TLADIAAAASGPRQVCRAAPNNSANPVGCAAGAACAQPKPRPKKGSRREAPPSRPKELQPTRFVDPETPGGTMDTARTTPIERIARVLAAHALSRNAEGDNPSAGEAVDAPWPDQADAALAVLKALRESSTRMAEAGDPAIWEGRGPAAVEDGPSETQ
ncbi:MAG TPA: hypothetical protein VN029_05165, partial [Sphingomonas sp.]|nr:hypothetical protein [Sphingomonas sp.]